MQLVSMKFRQGVMKGDVTAQSPCFISKALILRPLQFLLVVTARHWQIQIIYLKFIFVLEVDSQH